MLYELLGFNPWGPLQITQLSVVVLYCLDYIHVRGYLLGSDPVASAGGLDTLIDACVAVLFGLAFHSIEKMPSRAFACLAAYAVLILIYNLSRDRTTAIGFTIYVLMLGLFVVLMLFPAPTGSSAGLTCVSVLLYAFHVVRSGRGQPGPHE